MKSISIIICTRDRAGELANCLPETVRQAKTFDDVEVIVVDNGSADDTLGVVNRISLELGFRIRYVFEPIPGLSNARNRGRQEAVGRVLAFIDDDVIIGGHWVANIRKHFDSNKSDCLGGKVLAELGCDPPFQMDDSMLWFFQVTNFGQEPRRLCYPEHPIGCNMAFGTNIFDSVGGFDSSLKLYGDETDFFRRVHEANFSVEYDPNIEVTQLIPSERLTKEAIREKAFKWGQGSATIWAAEDNALGKRYIVLMKYAATSVYLWFRYLLQPTFGLYFTYWYNRGFISVIVRRPVS